MADDAIEGGGYHPRNQTRGIRFVVALPDRVTSHHLLKTILRDPNSKSYRCAKRTKAFRSAAGYFRRSPLAHDDAVHRAFGFGEFDFAELPSKVRIRSACWSGFWEKNRALRQANRRNTV